MSDFKTLFIMICLNISNAYNFSGYFLVTQIRCYSLVDLRQVIGTSFYQDMFHKKLSTDFLVIVMDSAFTVDNFQDTVLTPLS